MKYVAKICPKEEFCERFSLGLMSQIQLISKYSSYWVAYNDYGFKDEDTCLLNIVDIGN